MDFSEFTWTPFIERVLNFSFQWCSEWVGIKPAKYSSKRLASVFIPAMCVGDSECEQWRTHLYRVFLGASETRRYPSQAFIPAHQHSSTRAQVKKTYRWLLLPAHRYSSTRTHGSRKHTDSFSCLLTGTRQHAHMGQENIQIVSQYTTLIVLHLHQTYVHN